MHKRKRAKILSEEARKIISNYRNFGIRGIEKELRNKGIGYYRKNIKDYRKNDHNLVMQSSSQVDRHIVANFLGDWCFDIIINRGIFNKNFEPKKDFNDENKYPIYFPVFMHLLVVMLLSIMEIKRIHQLYIVGRKHLRAI